MRGITKAVLGAVALATAAMGAIAPANAARIVTTTTHVVTLNRPAVVVHRPGFFARRAWVRHAFLRHQRHMMMRQAFLTRR